MAANGRRVSYGDKGNPRGVQNGKKRTREACKIESYNQDIEKRITEAFEVFDHAGNKTVDVREIGTILRSLGCVPSEAEIQELIVNVEDQENAGSVHLDRFLPYVKGIINEYKLQPATAEDLLKAFHTLDQEGLGYITKEYMTKALMEGREPFTQEEIDEMMDVAVDPRTGTINYEMYINQIMID
ncbi:EF-hand calcium-binding domain-containing protein 2-like isoform X2 [Cimex lectularius]|uniref:EF-hand domain-containing protein n=1 Tax=Cimex lectularius TaxID=79782 RepID=A0A8I6RJX7_CIMLE|nr:EF-hand calcium-binding domain-containing protein 2-like isoform X2 [Cimex lectularius]